MFGRRTRETAAVYRYAFGKDKGSRMVLQWILESGGILKPVLTEEQRVAHNYVISLMENMGLTQGINYTKLVDFLIDSTFVPDEAIDK